MKTLRHFQFGQTVEIVSALSLLFATAQFAPLAAPPAKEKFIVPVAPITIEFPPKPETANDTLTISSPSVVIDESIAVKFGGQALAKMAVPSLENLLNNSGRFTVLLNGEAPYKVKATITSLKMSQTSAKKAAGVPDLLKTISKFAGKNKIDPELADLMTVDWSKDEVVIKVDCAVTVQIMDKDSRLIVGNTGSVTRENTIASIRGEFGGIAFGNVAGGTDAPAMDSVVPTKLIELAAYESLKQSIAAIDRELLQRKSIANKEPQIIAQTGETQAAPSKSKFCGDCGQTVAPGNKFCTACGKPLPK